MRRATAVMMAAVLGTALIQSAAWGQQQRGAVRVSAKPDRAKMMLDRPVAELKLDKVPLADALDFLRDATDANLHVNWRALESVGVTRESPVSVELRKVPLRKALNYVLAEQGPVTWFVDEGVIEVTTQEIADKHVYTRVYTVADLIMEVPDFFGPQFNIQQAGQGGRGGGGGQGLFQGQQQQQQQQQQPGNTLKDQRGRELADMVVQTIRPDVWRVNGGNATIAYFNGMLIVTAPRQVHEMIAGR